MGQFVENPADFSAQCRLQDGRCAVLRDNVLFLEDGNELDAVERLEWKCGYVVIIPDAEREGTALLYHTSCQRMADAVNQIFPGCLEAPVSLRQHLSEMTLGELHRHRVTISYDECRTRVDQFEFLNESQE